MSLVAVQVSDGNFQCDANITSTILDGRAKLLLIASATPDWLSAELTRLADLMHCPHLRYDHSMIKIATGNGSTLYARCIVFTDAKAAADIQAMVA